MTDAERNIIRDHVRESIQVAEKLLADEFVDLIARIAEAIGRAYHNGNKVILLGNGGSAADAQHLAAEFVGRYRCDRQALPAIALTSNGAALTAIGNDYGFDCVFARQVEATGVAGDIVVGMSTSGRSQNVITALRTAKARRMITIGLTGHDGGQIREIADYCLSVPSESTPSIQQAHMVIGHALCALIEREFVGLTRQYSVPDR